MLFKPDSPIVIVSASDAIVAALHSIHIDAEVDPWPGPEWDHFGGMLNGPNPPSPTAAPIRIVIGTKPQ
jgi:hypothetical protein